jgi:hypothetical protein
MNECEPLSMDGDCGSCPEKLWCEAIGFDKPIVISECPCCNQTHRLDSAHDQLGEDFSPDLMLCVDCIMQYDVWNALP